ncbi:(2Fe-2S)-binding protein [Streptomyces capparidis]
MPFADAYARLTAAFPGLRVHLGPAREGGGWVGAASLARDARALDALIALEADDSERDYGTRARGDVAASFGLHRYAWPACLLMSVPWFLDRRVPRLPVEHVSVNRAEGRMTALVTEFSCLPGDPAAGHPGARVVPDEEALRGALRAAVAEHLEPLLTAFRPRMRRGPRALWGMATDELVEGLLYLGHLFGDEERAAADLAALLPGRTPPFHGEAALRPVPSPGGGLPRYTRTRLSCCLFYTLRPDEVCATCPRTCAGGRAKHLVAH